MRNASLAEWTLARFMDRQRAASIVGDLEEEQKGALWFCWSVMGVTFSVAWRPVGGFLLAVVAGACDRRNPIDDLQFFCRACT
jgi:hypothetical protein